MAKSNEYIKTLIKNLGFILENGSNEIWSKKYRQHDDYIIKLDFDSEKIEYECEDKESSITVMNKTTSNFSQAENFVVLECVNRLLEKGYSPKSIELEHSWASGHGTSGRLDILVKKECKPYLMIECKTHGTEYNKERNNMMKSKSNGDPKGQLFSYGFQEKDTEYLCLYSSKYTDEDGIIYNNSIIQVEDEWKQLSNQREYFDHWNKNFKYNGIFDDNITPYNIKCKSLLRKDLKRITDEDSSKIFNQFLEILRHNAVSDKPNAFNKILNLFICKIIDEDRNDQEELLFQWKDDSTYLTLLSNLEDLYKVGMQNFLDIVVTDYSSDDIEKRLAVIDNQAKDELRKIFQELRLEKNPEFAFKEVYNKESFGENAKVVKEIVQLLQPYQFRYGHKQQFLGNFFELLLNTSIKQESGQFFTPVPIAKFMISSLPIKEVIDSNVNSSKKEILPVVIDYACGSGHFLTEYMDITQMIINNYNTSGLKKSIKNSIEKWKQTDNRDDIQGEFEWAKDYVYGIEKDYRLVKTTKISTFLNGDGEANIIHADGLDKFSSDKFKGHLSSINSTNNNFDFVIANPPYSVSSFKETLPSNNEDFELFDLVTNTSSEIETLFIERTNQLLREGGSASIILPSSILTNNNQSTVRAREIILENFHIKAIVVLGSNTFMATGTNTSIFFLTKRPREDSTITKKLVESFFKTHKDFSFNDNTNIIKSYVNESFEKIDFGDYVKYIDGEITENILNSRYFYELNSSLASSKDYKETVSKKSFSNLSNLEQENIIKELRKDFIRKTEKQKLIYFILTLGQKTAIVTTGVKQAEKNFLGYEFSNSRGSEGLRLYNDKKGNITSSLYSDDNFFDDKTKLNNFINSIMKDVDVDIPEPLRKNIKLINTENLISFDEGVYDNSMRINKKERLKFNCNSLPLSVITDIKIGGTPSRKNRYYFTGENLWVSISEMNGQTITDTKEKITNEAIKKSNVKLIKKGTTMISFKLSLGKVAIAGKDLYTNEAIASLEIRDEYKSKLTNEYIYYIFKSKAIDLKGDTKSFGTSLNSKKLGDIPIPFPKKEVQEDFIELCKKDINKAKHFFCLD